MLGHIQKTAQKHTKGSKVKLPNEGSRKPRFLTDQGSRLKMMGLSKKKKEAQQDEKG